MTAILEDTMRQESPRQVDSHGMSRQEEHLVRRLAKETDTPEHEALRTYKHERERLAYGAKVKTYVSIIAARHAREALKRKDR